MFRANFFVSVHVMMFMSDSWHQFTQVNGVIDSGCTYRVFLERAHYLRHLNHTLSVTNRGSTKLHHVGNLQTIIHSPKVSTDALNTS